MSQSIKEYEIKVDTIGDTVKLYRVKVIVDGKQVGKDHILQSEKAKDNFVTVSSVLLRMATDKPFAERVTPFIKAMQEAIA